jgi:hypothetical protein
MLSFRLCVVFFLLLATFMWLPPTLHLGVTAAIILLLIVPIARRWFTHRMR